MGLEKSWFDACLLASSGDSVTLTANSVKALTQARVQPSIRHETIIIALYGVWSTRYHDAAIPHSALAFVWQLLGMNGLIKTGYAGNLVPKVGLGKAWKRTSSQEYTKSLSDKSLSISS